MLYYYPISDITIASILLLGLLPIFIHFLLAPPALAYRRRHLVGRSYRASRLLRQSTITLWLLFRASKPDPSDPDPERSRQRRLLRTWATYRLYRLSRWYCNYPEADPSDLNFNIEELSFLIQEYSYFFGFVWFGIILLAAATGGQSFTLADVIFSSGFLWVLIRLLNDLDL